jgi:hypothetical protein
MNALPVLLCPATIDDAPFVAEIWNAGWRDGHLGGVPDELVAARTPDSFHKRAAERDSRHDRRHHRWIGSRIHYGHGR